MLLLTASLLISAMGSGCAEVMTSQQRDEHRRQVRIRFAAEEARSKAAFNEKWEAYRDKIESVELGMTNIEVVEIMGRPNDINTTVGSFGTHSQYVYDNRYLPDVYFYFENYILTTIQK